MLLGGKSFRFVRGGSSAVSLQSFFSELERAYNTVCSFISSLMYSASVLSGSFHLVTA